MKETLKRAVEFQRLGKTEEARNAYREALHAAAKRLLDAQRSPSGFHAVSVRKAAPTEGLTEKQTAARRLLATAIVHFNTGRRFDAIRAAEQALNLDPSLHGARKISASVRMDAGDLEGAADALSRVVADRPQDDDAKFRLAQAHVELGNEAAAKSLLDGLVSSRPGSAVYRSALGELSLRAGRTADAVRCFEEALAIDDACIAALTGLVEARQDPADLSRIRRTLESVRRGGPEEAALRFSLGRIHDRNGRFKEAWSEFAAANSVQRQARERGGRPYDAAEHRGFVERTCAAFDAKHFRRTARFGRSSPRPVFIVGFPRSGTTLVERILASHPSVVCVGERAFAQTSMAAATGRCADPFAVVPTLSAEAVRRAADWHLSKFDRFDPTRQKSVVDKLPENYLYLGWIATAFPDAKIIHCRRDPRDTALSCWTTNFARLPWSNDMESLADRMIQYRRVVDHFRGVRAVKMLEVGYEETVADLKGVARRLLKWVGLDWNDACLTFERSKGLVGTASMAQVRRPVQSSSVGRWRKYESHLAALFDRLPE